MATDFAQRLATLRKERGLSQKEVAISLGVSQALLSHYEKGVRECGLDFVVRCADYFGVTTDYLLGKHPTRFGLQPDGDDPNADEDKRLTMQSVLMCGNYIAEKFSVFDENFGDKLMWAYAVNLYRLFIGGLNSGRLSPCLHEHGFRADDKLFQELVKCVHNSLFLSSTARTATGSGRSADLPPFMIKMFKSVEEYITKTGMSCFAENAEK